MLKFPAPMQKLIRELTKLPTIGEKSAIRLAYHMLVDNPKLCTTLAEALENAESSIGLCRECFFLSEEELCPVCLESNRDEAVLCVVEKPMDMIAIERMGEYRGKYHVLHGVWAPLRGQSTEDLKLKELLERIEKGSVEEVIIATSATVEGDATALYVARLLEELGVRTSRLAQGISKGAELEFTDDVTLSRALAGRTAFSGVSK